MPAGIGYSEDGVARAGMGVDAADYDRSGYPSLVITNFSNQMMALYHNERNGLFVDEAPQSDVGHDQPADARLRLLFLRLRSGRLARIMYVANGHIEDAIERVQPRVRYAEPPHLFRNLGNGKFSEVTQPLEQPLRRRASRAARPMAISITMARSIWWSTTNDGPAVLFRNTGATNHSLRIKLVGTKSNRDGIGVDRPR